MTVPVYDSWRFHTAVPAGSFEDLAARLQPGDAPATTGRAALRYPRLADAPELEPARRARRQDRRTAQIVEEPLPGGVQADLAEPAPPAARPAGPSDRHAAPLRRRVERHRSRPKHLATSAEPRPAAPRHRRARAGGRHPDAGGSRRRGDGQPRRAPRGAPADPPPHARARGLAVAVAAPGAGRSRPSGSGCSARR